MNCNTKRIYFSRVQFFTAVLLIIVNIFSFAAGYATELEDVTLLIPTSSQDFYFNVAKEIFKIANIKLNTDIKSLPTIFKIMNSTEVTSPHVYSTVTVYNDDNRRYFYDAGRILQVDTAFFTLKKSKNKAMTLQSAKNLNNVCVWLDSISNVYLLDRGFTNLYPVPLMNECLSLLVSGKVDAWFNSENLVVKSFQSAKLDSSVLVKGYSPMHVSFFLAVTKSASESLLEKLVEASKKMHSSGVYDELVTCHENELFLPSKKKNKTGGKHAE